MRLEEYATIAWGVGKKNGERRSYAMKRRKSAVGESLDKLNSISDTRRKADSVCKNVRFDGAESSRTSITMEECSQFFAECCCPGWKVYQVHVSIRLSRTPCMDFADLVMEEDFLKQFGMMHEVPKRECYSTRNIIGRKARALAHFHKMPVAVASGKFVYLREFQFDTGLVFSGQVCNCALPPVHVSLWNSLVKRNAACSAILLKRLRAIHQAEEAGRVELAGEHSSARLSRVAERPP